MDDIIGVHDRRPNRLEFQFGLPIIHDQHPVIVPSHVAATTDLLNQLRIWKNVMAQLGKSFWILGMSRVDCGSPTNDKSFSVDIDMDVIIIPSFAERYLSTALFEGLGL